MAAPLSTGIEQVLRRALADPAFRSALLARRAAAADEAGISLTASERAILDSVTEQILDDMLARLPPVPVTTVPPEVVMMPAGVRPDLPVKTIALAAGAVLAGGALAATCLVAGNRPDVPPPVLAPATPPADPQATEEPTAPVGPRRDGSR